MESTDLQIFKVIVEILGGAAAKRREGNIDASQVSEGSSPSPGGTNSLTRVVYRMQARDRALYDASGEKARVTRSRRFRLENFDPSFQRRRRRRQLTRSALRHTTSYFHPAYFATMHFPASPRGLAERRFRYSVIELRVAEASVYR